MSAVFSCGSSAGAVLTTRGAGRGGASFSFFFAGAAPLLIAAGAAGAGGIGASGIVGVALAGAGAASATCACAAFAAFFAAFVFDAGAPAITGVATTHATITGKTRINPILS